MKFQLFLVLALSGVVIAPPQGLQKPLSSVSRSFPAVGTVHEASFFYQQVAENDLAVKAEKPFVMNLETEADLALPNNKAALTKYLKEVIVKFSSGLDKKAQAAVRFDFKKTQKAVVVVFDLTKNNKKILAVVTGYGTDQKLHDGLLPVLKASICDRSFAAKHWGKGLGLFGIGAAVWWNRDELPLIGKTFYERAIAKIQQKDASFSNFTQVAGLWVSRSTTHKNVALILLGRDCPIATLTPEAFDRLASELQGVESLNFVTDGYVNGHRALSWKLQDELRNRLSALPYTVYCGSSTYLSDINSNGSLYTVRDRSFIDVPCIHTEFTLPLSCALHAKNAAWEKFNIRSHDSGTWSVWDSLVESSCNTCIARMTSVGRNPLRGSLEPLVRLNVYYDGCDELLLSDTVAEINLKFIEPPENDAELQQRLNGKSRDRVWSSKYFQYKLFDRYACVYKNSQNKFVFVTASVVCEFDSLEELQTHVCAWVDEVACLNELLDLGVLPGAVPAPFGGNPLPGSAWPATDPASGPLRRGGAGAEPVLMESCFLCANSASHMIMDNLALRVAKKFLARSASEGQSCVALPKTKFCQEDFIQNIFGSKTDQSPEWLVLAPGLLPDFLTKAGMEYSCFSAGQRLVDMAVGASRAAKGYRPVVFLSLADNVLHYGGSNPMPFSYPKYLEQMFASNLPVLGCSTGASDLGLKIYLVCLSDQWNDGLQGSVNAVSRIYGNHVEVLVEGTEEEVFELAWAKAQAKWLV